MLIRYVDDIDDIGRKIEELMDEINCREQQIKFQDELGGWVRNNLSKSKY